MFLLRRKVVSFAMHYTKLPTTFHFPSSLSFSLLLRFTDDTFDPEIGATIGKCVKSYDYKKGNDDRGPAHIKTERFKPLK